MLFRIRLWEEVAGVRQSTYWWTNDGLLPPTEQWQLLLASRAEQLATFMRICHAIDHRYTSWEGQVHDETDLHRVTGWLSGEFPLGPVPGIILSFSGGPEIAVRLEQFSFDGPHVVLRYMPFIPETFLSGGVNINIAGLAAWGVACTGMNSILEMVMPKRGWFHDSIITPSAEVTTLNSRRKRVPQRSFDPVYP